MTRLLLTLVLLALAGCSATLEDRLASSKAIYTTSVRALAAVDDVKPFDPKSRKAIGKTFEAVEAQIDAGSASLQRGDRDEARVWIDQADAALTTAKRLTQ